MSNLPRVLVCDELHEEGLKLLQKSADVHVRPDLTLKELQEVVGKYHGLVVGPDRRITHDIIEEGLNLRVIGCAGARLDNIDVTTARAMGIEVRNSPSSNAVTIAEHTMTLMLQLISRPAAGDGRLAGKTLGIIGFGHIGRQVARRAIAFDMNVVVNQPRLTPELALDEGVEVADLFDLLAMSDLVTLHVPLKAETDALLGADELKQMKEGAFLINTGHTDVVDDAALLAALDEGYLAGAAVPEYPEEIGAPTDSAAVRVRHHPRVLVAPHVTSIIGDRRRDIAVKIARQVVELLRVKRPSETLALEVVPISQVTPHEQIDEKRVTRLMKRLQNESRLINPPIVTEWNDRYVILDGATRFTSLKRLNYPHIIVQIVDARRDDFDLHTWYHVISSKKPVTDLFAQLREIDGIMLEPLRGDAIQTVFRQPEALCYFLDRENKAMLVRAQSGADNLGLMCRVVDCYNQWGAVERTLITDLSRLRGQFPDMRAVAIFPQFTPATVFENASQDRLLPAGLTRFVIPGRILRLNADLARLKSDEPLIAKRAWLNQYLADKLARSRLRYYQEPVILLDE